MSIKKQKLIMFIPFINLINVFFWVLNSYRSGFNIVKFLKRSVLTMLVLVLILVPEIIIDTTCSTPLVLDITQHVTIYLQMFTFSFCAVRFQEIDLQDKE